jgi:hypothetical protein
MCTAGFIPARERRRRVGCWGDPGSSGVWWSESDDGAVEDAGVFGDDDDAVADVVHGMIDVGGLPSGVMTQ